MTPNAWVALITPICAVCAISGIRVLGGWQLTSDFGTSGSWLGADWRG